MVDMLRLALIYCFIALEINISIGGQFDHCKDNTPTTSENNINLKTIPCKTVITNAAFLLDNDNSLFISFLFYGASEKLTHLLSNSCKKTATKNKNKAKPKTCSSIYAEGVIGRKAHD